MAEVILPEDWYVPGGAVIGGGTLRLKPPPDWDRVILELPRVPPSMNNNQIRSHWRGYHEQKKSWEEEIGRRLMMNGLRRGRYERVLAGAFMRFRDRSIRDPPNFAGLVNKALGDALVIAKRMPIARRYIPDDDGQHYFFGGVEIEEETGPPRTRIYIYLQPKET